MIPRLVQRRRYRPMLEVHLRMLDDLVADGMGDDHIEVAQQCIAREAVYRAEVAAFERGADLRVVQREHDGWTSWRLPGSSALHRTDGPAAFDDEGNQQWFELGVRHRADGPAVINSDGTTQWWVNGEQLEDAPSLIS